MKVDLHIYQAADWAQVAEDFHRAVFGDNQDRDWDRYDFVILATRDDKPLGYITCREINKETLHWKYGGCLFGARGGAKAVSAYRAAIQYCFGRWRNVFTLIRNDNLSSLRLAMGHGFLVIGVQQFDDETFVQLKLNLDHACKAMLTREEKPDGPDDHDGDRRGTGTRKVCPSGQTAERQSAPICSGAGKV